MGRKGFGKTTLATELIAGQPRVVVLDMLGGYGHAVTDVVWERDPAIEALLIASKKPRFQLALRMVSQDDMLDVLDMAFELEDYLLVVEETSLVCGTPPYLHRELAQLVRFGRHRRISQIYIARRPTELPRDLTAMSDLLVTFNQKEPRDLQYLAENGFDPDIVARLPKFMVAAQGDVDLPEPIRRRMSPAAFRAFREDVAEASPDLFSEESEAPLTDSPEDDSSSGEGSATVESEQ